MNRFPATDCIQFGSRKMVELFYERPESVKVLFFKNLEFII